MIFRFRHSVLYSFGNYYRRLSRALLHNAELTCRQQRRRELAVGDQIEWRCWRSGAVICYVNGERRNMKLTANLRGGKEHADWCKYLQHQLRGQHKKKKQHITLSSPAAKSGAETLRTGRVESRF